MPSIPKREQQRREDAARKQAREPLGPARLDRRHRRRRRVELRDNLVHRLSLEGRQLVAQSLVGRERQRGVLAVEAGDLDRRVDHRLGEVAGPALGLGGRLHLLAEVGDDLGLDWLHLAALDLHRRRRADGRAARHRDDVGGERDQRARRDRARMHEGDGLRAAAQQRVAHLHRRIDAPAEGVDVENQQIAGGGIAHHAAQERGDADVDFTVERRDDEAPGRPAFGRRCGAGTPAATTPLAASAAATATETASCTRPMRQVHRSGRRGVKRAAVLLSRVTSSRRFPSHRTSGSPLHWRSPG